MKVWLLLIWISHSDGRVSGNIHEQPFYNAKACADIAAEMQPMLAKELRNYGYKCVEVLVPEPPPQKGSR